MKKILLYTLIAFFVLPFGTTVAHEQYKLPAVTIDTDFSQFSNCNGNTQCEEGREKAIILLRALIAELVQRVEELQAQADDSESADTDVDDSEVGPKVSPHSNIALKDIKDSTYAVKSDGTLASSGINQVPQVALDIWEDFKKVSPDEYTQDYISFLRVYYDDEDPFAAYVETDPNDRKTWVLGINLYNSNNSTEKKRQNLVETLVHEFAHVLTLAEDQVDGSVSQRRCGTHYVGEGCLFKNSYLNGFVEEFWTKDDFENSEDIQDNEDDFDEQEEIAVEYYRENRDRFVSAYATTNAAEDIAESFASFVLEDKPSNDRDEQDGKLLYFFDFTELVEIRNSIRDNFQTLFNF